MVSQTKQVDKSLPQRAYNLVQNKPFQAMNDTDRVFNLPEGKRKQQERLQSVQNREKAGGGGICFAALSHLVWWDLDLAAPKTSCRSCKNTV